MDSTYQQKPEGTSEWRWAMTQAPVFNWLSVAGVMLLVLAAAAEAWDRRYGAAGTLSFFTVLAVASTWWLWTRAPILAFLLVMSSVVNAWGWVWEWYQAIGWYDEAAHFLTPVAVTPVVAWYLLEQWIDASELKQNRIRIAIVVVAIGTALGSWWEIGEWIAYLRTNDPHIIKSLQDTITDLILDCLGSAAGLPIFFSIKRISLARAAMRPHGVPTQKF